MPKLSIKTNLLAPAGAKTVQYIGFHPSQVFKLVPEFIQDYFGVEPGGLFEDEVRWDVTAAQTSFYGYWRGKVKKDNLSVVWFHVQVSGTQDKDKKGDVSIKIKGALGTSFKYSTIIDKNIFRLYMGMFYKNHRQRYIADANKLILDFEDAVRSHFDLMRRAE